MRDKLEGFCALGAILAGLFGVVLGILAYQEWVVYAAGDPTPQRLTCAQLAASGPGNNINVVVSDLEFGNDYVYEEKNGSWNIVWIPIFPKQGGRVTDNRLRVLVKTFHVKNAGEVEPFCQRQVVAGVITNKIHSLGSEEKKLLSDGYPGADFSNVHIIEEGRSFPSKNTVTFMWFGTAALIGVAIVCGMLLLYLKFTGGAVAVPVRRRRRRRRVEDEEDDEDED